MEKNLNATEIDSRLIKCPVCGNDESFSLLLDYLKINIIKIGGEMIGRWEEGEAGSLCCNNCGHEFDFALAELVYAEADLSAL